MADYRLFAKRLEKLKTDFLKDKNTTSVDELMEEIQKIWNSTKGAARTLAFRLERDGQLLNNEGQTIKLQKFSDVTGTNAFREFLDKKLKNKRAPIKISIEELIKESGTNVKSGAAYGVLRKTPKYKNLIDLTKEGRHPYDQLWKDTPAFKNFFKGDEFYKNKTWGNLDYTSKKNAYQKYLKDVERKQVIPKNYITPEEFAKKLDTTVAGLSTKRVKVKAGQGDEVGKYIDKNFAPKRFAGEIYYKDPTVMDLRKYKEFQRRPLMSETMADYVKKLHDHPDIKAFLKKGELPPLASVQDALGVKSPHTAANAMKNLARVFKGDRFRKIEGIELDKVKGSRLIRQMGRSGRFNEYKTAFYKAAVQEIDKLYKGKVGTLTNFRNLFNDQLNDMLGKGHGWSINEVIGVSTGESRGLRPYSAFVDLTQANINEGQLAHYQGQLSNKLRQVDRLMSQGKEEQALKAIKKFNTKTIPNAKVLLGTKYDLSSKELAQLNLAEIVPGETIDPEIYSPSQLERWKTKGLDIEGMAKEKGYYLDVKRGTPFWEADFNKIEKIFEKDEGGVCAWFPKAAASGGPIKKGCGAEFRAAMQQDADGTIQRLSEMPAKGGPWSRIKTGASNILNKIPKGGRLGAILAGAGAVGAGTWAMMGGAKADDTRTTDQMTYNATEGKFVKPDGDPETQEGILNWIGEHPIYSGLAPIPVGMGAGLGADAMGYKNLAKFFGSAKFFLPPAYAAEKIYQYKQGQDLGEMFTNPIDAIWAMALDTPKSRLAKMNYYKQKGQSGVGLSNVKSWKGVKDIPRALKHNILAPASRGSRLVFPFATEKYGFGKPITEGWRALAPSGIKRGLGMAARMLPLGPIPLALVTASEVWDKYKFNKEVGSVVDAMRARGVVSEEDAQTMSTIYKQGWLGTTALGAKLLGSEELMFEGEMLDLDAQKRVLAGMKEHYENREKTGKEFRADERQEDFFSWFSGGGRVGLAEGGNKSPFTVTRRGFLKWLVGSIAAGVAAVSGKGIKQAAKTATATVAKTPAKFIGVEGMPLWFPRAVAKIKTHGKLIEMADKHYTQGDIYEMMIPIKIPKFDRVAGKELPSGFETRLEKVTLEENPLSGEINMHWTGTDNFGGDAVRQINFKPGSAGYQKFGVDDPQAAAKGITEYQRVKVEEPEFSYTQPDQSRPMRDDIEYLDIFEEGDEIVKGLEDMTGGKQMVTKDGTVIDVSAEGKGVDEAFQKKIYKDIEGEEALIPEPEGVGISKEGEVYGEEGYNEIIGGIIPDHLKKKASGGRVGMKFGGSWADWMSNHSDDMTFEEYLKMDFDKPVHPINKNAGGIIETGNIARRPGAVPPLSGPTPQGQGIVGLFSSPKRVNIA